MKNEELIVSHFDTEEDQKMALNIFRSIANTDTLSTFRILEVITDLELFTLYEHDFNTAYDDIQWSDEEAAVLLNNLTTAATALYDYFNKDELTEDARKVIDFMSRG